MWHLTYEASSEVGCVCSLGGPTWEVLVATDWSCSTGKPAAKLRGRSDCALSHSASWRVKLLEHNCIIFKGLNIVITIACFFSVHGKTHS